MPAPRLFAVAALACLAVSVAALPTASRAWSGDGGAASSAGHGRGLVTPSTLSVTPSAGVRGGPDCNFQFPEIPTKGDALDASNDAPTVLASNKLVYFGYSVNVPNLGLAYTFDFTTCSWNYTTNPIDYVAGAAAVVDDIIYVIGGGHKGSYNGPNGPVKDCHPKSAECMEDRVWAVNATGPTLQFTNMPAMGAKLAYEAAVVYDKQILVIGGYTQNQVSGEVLVFDVPTESWVLSNYLPLQPGRWGHSAAVVGSVAYVFGGQGTNTADYFADVQALNLTVPRQPWRQMHAAPQGKAFMGVVLYACQIYVMGGAVSKAKATSVTDSVNVYDPHSDSWATINPLTLPDPSENLGVDHFGTVALFDARLIYNVGGEGGTSGSTAIQYTEAYQPCILGRAGTNCQDAGRDATLCAYGFFLQDGDCLQCPGTNMDSSLCAGPCSGHGTCDAQGMCHCDSTYAGRSCESCAVGRGGTGCEACITGYFGPECTACPGVIAHNSTCSGHGVCDGSGTNTGTGVCSCDIGWAGDMCDQCAFGFFGHNCTKCPGPLFHPCYDHGICSDGMNGTGSCSCFREFTGEYCKDCTTLDLAGQCEFCVDGYWGPKCKLCPGGIVSRGPQNTANVTDVCTLNGECDGSGTNSGTGVCHCRTGWAGVPCDQCAAGYWGTVEDCAACPGMVEAQNTYGTGFSECNYHGFCGGAGSRGSCECTSSWTGPTCCESTDCPGPAFVVGISLVWLVALVAMGYGLGPRFKTVLVLFFPAVQVLSLYSEFSGVRLFSIVGGEHGGLQHIDTGAAPQLRAFLQGLDIAVNLGFSRSMYLQHCQDKAASTAFAGLWLPPLLTPIVAALVLTVGFFWRAKTTSRAQQRPWLLRGVFLAFLVTFVWTSTGSLEVFMCSERDLCDPMREPFACATPNSTAILAFGIACSVVFLLVGPGALAWITSSSPTAVRLRTFVDHGRTADSLLPLLGEETEASASRDADTARKRRRTVSGAKPGITNYLIIEPVPPLDFLGIAFHTNSSARRWAAAFVVRRLVVVVTVVFIKFWPVQLSVLLGVPLIWTLVREYFRPFKVPTYRWYDRILTAVDALVIVSTTLMNNAADLDPVPPPAVEPESLESWHGDGDFNVDLVQASSAAAMATTVTCFVVFVGILFNEARLHCSRKSDKVHPAGAGDGQKRPKGKRKRRKRKGKGDGDGSRRKGRRKRGSKVPGTNGAGAGAGVGAGAAAGGASAGNGSASNNSRALTNVVASMAASQGYGDSSSEYETGSEWGGSTVSGAVEQPVILQDGAGQSYVLNPEKLAGSTPYVSWGSAGPHPPRPGPGGSNPHTSWGSGTGPALAPQSWAGAGGGSNPHNSWHGAGGSNPHNSWGGAGGSNPHNSWGGAGGSNPHNSWGGAGGGSNPHNSWSGGTVPNVSWGSGIISGPGVALRRQAQPMVPEDEAVEYSSRGVPPPAGPAVAPSFCSECGTRLQPAFNVCPECGTPVPGRAVRRQPRAEEYRVASETSTSGGSSDSSDSDGEGRTPMQRAHSAPLR